MDPVTYELKVRPVFYGMMAFQELVSNYSQWTTATVTASVTTTSDPLCQDGIVGSMSGAKVCCASRYVCGCAM
jgi:hypothetical protein